MNHLSCIVNTPIPPPPPSCLHFSLHLPPTPLSFPPPSLLLLLPILLLSCLSPSYPPSLPPFLPLPLSYPPSLSVHHHLSFLPSLSPSIYVLSSPSADLYRLLHWRHNTERLPSILTAVTKVPGDEIVKVGATLIKLIHVVGLGL